MTYVDHGFLKAVCNASFACMIPIIFIYYRKLLIKMRTELDEICDKIEPFKSDLLKNLHLKLLGLGIFIVVNLALFLLLLFMIMYHFIFDKRDMGDMKGINMTFFIIATLLFIVLTRMYFIRKRILNHITIIEVMEN